MLVRDRTRGPELLGLGVLFVGRRPLGHGFLHTLQLFDDRMLLVDLDRGGLGLAA